MYPDKPRTGWMFRQPRFCTLHHVYAATLDTAPARLIVCVLGKVVVEIEPAIKTWRESFCVKNDSSDKCRRVIALPFQQLRPGRMIRSQWDTKIRYAVRTRKQASQDGCVRGIRDRAWRERFSEANAIRSKRIDSRSLDFI